MYWYGKADEEKNVRGHEWYFQQKKMKMNVNEKYAGFNF